MARFVGRLVQRRPIAPEGLGERDRLVPPGYRAFIVLGLLLGGAVGVTAGLLTGWSVGIAVAMWASAGLGYGLALWVAAHHGYLPFPEPD